MARLGQVLREAAELAEGEGEQAAAGAEGSKPGAVALLKPRELAGLIQSLANLGVEPDSSFYSLLVGEAERGLPQCEPSELSGILMALAEFEQRPPASFLRHYVAVAEQRLDRFSSADLVSMLKGLAMLEHNPGLAFMDAWVREAELQLPGFAARDLAGTVKGLAVLKYHPGRPFLELLVNAAKPRISDFTPRDLSITANSLFHLSFMPPPAFARAFTAHALTQLPQFSPRELACIINGYAGLGSMVFGKSFVENVMVKCVWQLTGMAPRELAGTISGIAVLRAQPPSEFLEVFVREALARLHDFGPKDVHKMLTALARFNSEARRKALASPRFLEAVAARAEKQAGALSPAEVVDVVEALEVLGVRPGPELLRAAEEGQRLVQMEATAFTAAQ